MAHTLVSPPPPSYRRVDTRATLREALTEHHASTPALVEVPSADEGELSEIDALFAGHDACHALFGLGSTVGDEIRVDTWTLFATTMSVRRYLAYMTHPVTTKVLRETTTWRSVPAILGALLDVPRIALRARRMRRVWDFDGWRAWVDTPLSELRARFGVEVL